MVVAVTVSDRDTRLCPAHADGDACNADAVKVNDAPADIAIRGRGSEGVEQHRHGVGIKVCNSQIELAIPVQIAHRDGYRAYARGEVLVGSKTGRGGGWGGGVKQH